MIGEIVSHYKILQKLGSGGMGEVYLAEDTKLKRKTVLKFLHPHLTEDREILERFQREAQAAAALNHSNIVTIYEIDQVEVPGAGRTQTFIAMEYVGGHSLREHIKNGSLKIDRTIEILLQLCEGLEEAHKAGIVHRDIKPENILIDKVGRVKILDFGLAQIRGASKLTKEASTLGTAYYISPEQYKGEKVDHRADIWSLGVLMYEMLAGRVPFEGDYEQAVMYSILNEEPKPIRKVNPTLSKEIENLLNTLLKKERKDRYQHCREIIDELHRQKMEHHPEMADTEQKPKHMTKKPILFLVPLVILILIVSWFVVLKNQTQKLDSIAILPFQNHSVDPNLEFLSREIPANIINSLSRLSDLRVVPRTTVFRYMDRESDLVAIGQELGVATALTGEVSLIGERLVIRAELVDIKNNSQIWGDRFERKFDDLLEIEEEITREISEALPLHLTGEQKSNLVKRYTENIEAYRAYMEGRFWWNKRSQEGFDKAELLFKKAIDIDPDYALAYAGLAECYCMISMHLAKPEPVIRQARIAAEKALSLDEALAEAHAALGWIKFAYDWDWLGAERSFKLAIQLNPHYATVYNWYAGLLSVIDRHEEAIRYMIQAQQLDPGSAIINRDLGVFYAWAGDFEKAIDQLQFTIDMDPDFSPAYHIMGVVYAWMKNYDLAIEYIEKVRTMSGDFLDIIGMLGFIYAKSGQREKALGELKKIEELAGSQYARAFEFSIIHSGLGNIDQALEWLEIAYKNREFAVVLLGVESEVWYEDLLSDPRFKELLRKVGFEE